MEIVFQPQKIAQVNILLLNFVKRLVELIQMMNVEVALKVKSAQGKPFA